MAEGCVQLLQFYLLYLGVQTRVEDAFFQPVHGLPQIVRCRGQVIPGDPLMRYRMVVKEIQLDPIPYAIADIDILVGDRVVVDFRDLGVQLLEMALESLTPVEACRLSVFFDRYTRHGLSPADIVLERYYFADEGPQKWIQMELEASREKECTFLNFPCQFPEIPVDSCTN